ncbi:MAG TPA: sulfite exporter TauE/SafE family protein [Bacteroidota bacterium]|nr:sulfite exporter TauE/SafE family protein [Bacteroidota bacterium]
MELLITGLIAFTVSILSGMLGLGGAVILIPAYLYIPGFFGLTGLDVKSISGMTSLQVLFSSLVGMMFHRKRGAVDKRLVFAMGIPITAASLAGAMFSKSVASGTIIAIFGIMAIVGVVFVFMKKESPGEELPAEFSFNMPGAIAIAAAVGFFGGMVGAPGAFLLAPLMMTVLKIPTRITIGSTLGIVCCSAFAASVGKLWTGQVPYLPTAVAVASSIPGVLLGSSLSHRLPTKQLRLVLGLLIGAVAAQMLYRALTS